MNSPVAPIESTDLAYATNTNETVIKVGSQYFLLQDGVWFVADSPDGPWQLARTVPDEIYQIPPSSPVYNAINEDDHRYAAAQFSEGHVAQVEVSGILKSANQPELARQFLLHMLTPDAQAAIAMTNYMYPVIAEAEALLPEPFLAQERPSKVLPVDGDEVATAGRDWIDTALGALQ